MPRKKNKDFVKVKLKAGKRLPKHLNETKPEFTAKKIQVKPLLPQSNVDPIKLLAAGKLSNNLKIVYLNKLRANLSSIDSLTQGGEQVQVMCKYLIDVDARVRTEAINCLKKCLELFTKNTNKNGMTSQGLTPLFSIMLSFINCGITHINQNIRTDSQKLLSFVVDHCDGTLYGQLMEMILAKIESAFMGTLDVEYYAILEKLIKRFHLANESNEKENEEVMPETSADAFHWSPDNCTIDIRSHEPAPRHQDICFTFQSKTSLNVKEKFLEAVQTMVLKDIKFLFGKSHDRPLTSTEAQKAIAALRISLDLKIHQQVLDYWTLPSGTLKIPSINITTSNVASQSEKRVQKKMQTSLEHQMSQMFNHLHKLFKNRATK